MGSFANKLMLTGAFAVCLGFAPSVQAGGLAKLFAGAPISTAELAQTRAGSEETTLPSLSSISSNLSAQVTLNNSGNTIDGGSFAGASGAFTIIQNIGSNVVILAHTSIVINYVD